MPDDPRQSQRIEGSSIESSQVQLGQTDGGDLNQIQGSNNWVVKFVFNLFGSQQSSPHQTNRYRQRLLDKVRKSWVEDVLEKSLFNEVQIELGLERCFDTLAVDYEVFEQSRQPLPEGTKVSEEFFDQLGLGRAILILGESGAGKTTILLELARDLLARAEQETSLPIPVVFNLSSWSRQPLADWLVQELNKSPYGLSPSLSKAWLRDQQLFLLLDGFNEVFGKENQELCIEEINKFNEQYDLVDIAICSCIDSYERLATRLNFQHDKVFINSLSLEQVENQLNQANGLEEIRSALYTDPVLQTLVRTPLMLNIMILAYRGKPVDELLCLSLEERRERLWDTYIQIRWKRGKRSSHYPRNQAISWLIWLAQNMRTSSNVFLIEELQPNRLNSKQRYIYEFCSFYVSLTLIPLPLTFLVMFCAFPSLLESFNFGGVIFILIVSLWFTAMLYFDEEQSDFKKLKGLQKIKTVEVFNWSMKDSVSGLIQSINIDYHYRYFKNSLDTSDSDIHSVFMSYMYIILLPISLIFLLPIFVIFSPLMGVRTLKLETRIEPNQGIWRSLKNSIIAGFVGGLMGALAGQYFVFLFYLLILWIGEDGSNIFNISILAKSSLIFFGLLGLYFGWAFNGGIAITEHFILRLILSKTGKIPYNYSRFLDWATERSFLRKVGGGYIFIHSSLMEHFAQMKQESQNR